MVLPKGFWWLVVAFITMFTGHKAMSEQFTLLQQASLLGARAPLFEGAGDGGSNGSASLFVGQQGTSLFAPYAPRRSSTSNPMSLGGGGTQVDRLFRLIASAEAGKKGYDAVQYGARRKPFKRPTQMTIHEIYVWIKQTPGQPHAIGRYQFIPATLRRLVKSQGIPHGTVFSPKVQDQLAYQLLVEGGLDKFRSGKISRTKLMNNLAKIWAGLPTSSGKSYYHGYAGNSSTITWAYYAREMAKIFPG